MVWHSNNVCFMVIIFIEMARRGINDMLSTPRYIFNKATLRESYINIQSMITAAEVHYALKANGEMELLHTLKDINAGFEVASDEEFEKLKRIDVPLERIICGLPVKTAQTIRFLYGQGCRYFVFDHVDEYRKICRNAPDAKKILRIYITDLCSGSIEYGMHMSNVEEFIGNDSNRFDGLSFHISGNDNIDLLFRVLDRVEALLQKIPQKSLILNIGGGFRIETREDFFHKLDSRLWELKNTYSLRILCEPGQYIVKKSGVIITKIVAIREQDNVFNVFIDAGFPTGIHRKPEYIKLYNRKRTPNVDRKIKIYRFFDNTCMHQELFIQPFRFYLYEEDYLEMGYFGSYSICRCNNFHSWKTPKVDYYE